jgi:uncharacterized membrane protein YecN with MAPEG domain
MNHTSSIAGMLPPLITPLYAAFLGILFTALSVRTLRLRRKLRIRLGDDGHPEMLRAIRVHANFAEYVPLCLGLIFLAEVQSAPGLLIHTLGSALIVARLIHAYGVSQAEEKIKWRVIGISVTLTTQLGACFYLVTNYRW